MRTHIAHSVYNGRCYLRWFRSAKMALIVIYVMCIKRTERNHMALMLSCNQLGLKPLMFRI